MPGSIENISVLMPAFNCGKYIGAAINSILNQTFKKFELIIIDDGSTDNTEKVVRSFPDTRIVYKKTENKGTSAALNYGLGIAKYTWVARIDADDLNTPERLEKQVNFLNANPDYNVISSWSVYFRDPANILFLLKEPIEHDDIYEYLDLHNPLNQSSLMFRKEIIQKAKYNETYTSYEDFELFHRIRNEAKFHNLPEFLTYTRLRDNSRSHNAKPEEVYDFLFPAAFKNMIDAKSKGEHFYWASNIAWINYFFGKRKDARSYFKSSLSFKNTIALVSTFLPYKYFQKLIDSRIKYRFFNVFASNKLYKNELLKLMKT